MDDGPVRFSPPAANKKRVRSTCSSYFRLITATAPHSNLTSPPLLVALCARISRFIACSLHVRCRPFRGG